MPALTGLAAAAGVPVVLDTHGAALRHGAAAGPAIVKPNLAELAGRGAAGRWAARAGRPWPPRPAELRAAVGARRWSSRSGADGLHAVTAAGSWRAGPPGAVAGQPDRCG